MKAKEVTRKRVRDWIDASLHQLAPTNPLHIHIAELVGGGSRQEMLSAVKEPFLDAIDILGDRLIDVMPVLVVPLESLETFVCGPPNLEALDLASESPSIYLEHRDGAKTLRAGELYRCFLRDFTVFDRHPADVFFFYEVFKGERERAAGWEYTRTILGEHYLPAQRTGWHSTLESGPE